MREAVTYVNEVVKPATPEGDEYYGLKSGTNGTAAATRRAMVSTGTHRWVCFNGGPPVGLQLIPTNEQVKTNQWDGK
jgi:hypothetical protein